MVGKIRNLTFSSIIVISILIFTKNLLYPLIAREAFLQLNKGTQLPLNSTSDPADSLSTFSFLYGTFPTAPSLLFYVTRFDAIETDIISAALVFGTLASAPLMMISGN